MKKGLLLIALFAFITSVINPNLSYAKNKKLKDCCPTEASKDSKSSSDKESKDKDCCKDKASNDKKCSDKASSKSKSCCGDKAEKSNDSKDKVNGNTNEQPSNR